jgi:hypothetical protein
MTLASKIEATHADRAAGAPAPASANMKGYAYPFVQAKLVRL